MFLIPPLYIHASLVLSRFRGREVNYVHYISNFCLITSLFILSCPGGMPWMTGLFWFDLCSCARVATDDQWLRKHWLYHCISLYTIHCLILYSFSHALFFWVNDCKHVVLPWIHGVHNDKDGFEWTLWQAQECPQI